MQERDAGLLERDWLRLCPWWELPGKRGGGQTPRGAGSRSGLRISICRQRGNGERFVAEPGIGSPVVHKPPLPDTAPCGIRPARGQQSRSGSGVRSSSLQPQPRGGDETQTGSNRDTEKRRSYSRSEEPGPLPWAEAGRPESLTWQGRRHRGSRLFRVPALLWILRTVGYGFRAFRRGTPENFLMGIWEAR